MHHNRPSRRREKRTPKPLDRTSLRDLALAYVARYATTSGKLERYLARKLRERGWDGEGAADPAALAADFVERGYIDDAGWAQGRSHSLAARGYGPRRIAEDLRAAGIDEHIRDNHTPAVLEARRAAVRLARRRRFGPFSGDDPKLDERAGREKQLAAMVRAGHDFATARRVIEARGEAELLEWVAEAQEDDNR